MRKAIFSIVVLILALGVQAEELKSPNGHFTLQFEAEVCNGTDGEC